MATREQLQQSYLDTVLTTGEKPTTVYAFAKSHEMSEEEFYRHFGSFEALEGSIWTDLTSKTIAEIEQQEIWAQYSSRDKILAFFYAYMELLKSKRSFIVYSLNNSPKNNFRTPALFEDTRKTFEAFAESVLQEGLASGELAERRFLSKRYKDGLWLQFHFLINFWAKDNSANFEKTDEAIEKGVNVTFDLFQRSPIDNLIDYGKFLVNNGGFTRGGK